MSSPHDQDVIRRRAEATAVFRLALKADKKAFHRTLNREPKGKGWVQCHDAPQGLLCRPEKVRETIELYRKAYAILPDIVVLNQIALAYELLGEFTAARTEFDAMSRQAVNEGNIAYEQAARLALERMKGR